MSKVPQRNKPSKKRPKPHKQKTLSPTRQQSKIKFIVLIIVVILAAIPFGLGKYFEFNSPGPFDSGSNVYSAKHILNGAKIGIEEKSSAALGTLLVNIVGVWLFGFNETGPKLIQAIMQAAALALMFIAMRKLFGTLSAAVGVIVASVYLSSPLIAKFGNVKEQYMIACIVMGISCFVLYQLGGRWWYAVLAGAFVSWAPLFKPTGTSMIGAIGLFVIAQPLFKHRTWKQTGVDILLLLAGAAVAIGPLYIWIIGWDVRLSLPYKFAWQTLANMLPAKATISAADAAGTAKAASGGYISEGRKLVSFAQQWPRVLRYYGLLILPVALAVGAVVARITRMIWARLAKPQDPAKKNYDRFVLLFAVWWLLDMAFVWISPRSYEQYYLPLNASAAMLGGYLIALYCDKVTNAVYKTRWVIVGLIGFLLMIIMSWHIFFGIEKSPHSGSKYGEKRRGYAQKLNEISRRRKENLRGAWEVVGEYIRTRSEPTDKIYVWGWYPGIYVKAQRFSAATKAFSMPRPAPQKLTEIITSLMTEFEKERPKFIVDSRKRHVPLERPPYELWPIVLKDKYFQDFLEKKKPQFLLLDKKTQIAFAYLLRMKEPKFLPLDKDVIEAYDKLWGEWLGKRFGEDEALRYEALKPFREFVMKNYQIVPARFGQHVLFKLKNSTENKELQ